MGLTSLVATGKTTIENKFREVDFHFIKTYVEDLTCNPTQMYCGEGRIFQDPRTKRREE